MEYSFMSIHFQKTIDNLFKTSLKIEQGVEVLNRTSLPHIFYTVHRDLSIIK